MKLALLKLSGKSLSEFLTNSKWILLVEELQKKYDGLVIVHGAGKDISDWSEKLGYKSEFIDGQRITTPEIMNVVSAVQSGMTNGKIVSHLLSKGFDSIGLTGADRNLFLAVSENKELGLVGIPQINKSSGWISDLLKEKVIPVFSSVCRNENGQLMNVNADIFANALAVELKVSAVFFNSDIDGVIINKEVKHKMTESIIKESILNGQVYGGMIPKLNSAVELVKSGIGQVWIGSSNPDDLLDLLTGKQQKGTLIIPEINPEGVVA